MTAPPSTPHRNGDLGSPEPRRPIGEANTAPLSPRSSNAMPAKENSYSKLPIASQYSTKSYSNNYPFDIARATAESGSGDPSTMSPQATTSSRINGAMPVSPPTRPSPNSRLGMAPTSAISSVRNISVGFNKASVDEDKYDAKDASTNGDNTANATAPKTRSGIFIERITKENDMLKRDVNIYKLQANEAKSELRMAIQKMDQVTADCELQLLNASANETLLARRDRQLAETKELVDRERHRADAAVESEKVWKEQMEKTEREAKNKVDEATNYAALLEGRYNTVTGHWDDQKKELDDTVQTLDAKITTILEQRHQDCETMNSLQATCDQKDAQLTALEKEKEAIAKAFEEYKLEQERGLKDIKTRSQEQEKANEETLREAQKVLGELKWALQVKKNVKDADTR